MSAATAVIGALMADRHWPAAAANPCRACLHGDPDRCTGVGCYRCTCGCRDRRHGCQGSARDESAVDGERHLRGRAKARDFNTLRVDP